MTTTGATKEMAVPKLPGQNALDRQILREGSDGWHLVGTRCSICGTTFFPPRELCPNDISECEEVDLSRRGRVYEATPVFVAPVGFEAPYWVGYVDLPEGVRLFTQIEWNGDGEPHHGAEVEYVIKVVRTQPEVLGPVFVGPV